MLQDPVNKPDVNSGKLHLGCPVWACEHWRGALYTAKAPRSEWLRQYSAVFNTVEGNSTFYALPKLSTVQEWADSVSRGFCYAMKVPRVITHDLRLQGAERETAAFVDVLSVLDAAHRIGPAFIQLPPDFGPDQFERLERYLRSLPTWLQWAVEVRHHEWYDKGANEWRLDELLIELGMDKVLFDSRPLFSAPPADQVEKISQSRKPRTPVRRTVTGQHPFLRIVGRNQLSDVTPWIAEWAPVIVQWLRQGLSPYVFAHAPDDRHAPEFARRIYLQVRSLMPELPELAAWPGESRSSVRHRQKLLFDGEV